MLLVNNPGTWSAIWPPLRHAEWHGCTPADLIFPFFLLVVGITTELSKKEPVGILRRGLLIVLFGLLVNAFPYFKLETLRWTGVLQRIGIVYIIAALIAWKASRRAIAILIAAILLGYWLVMAQGPYEPPVATIAAHVDRMLIPEAHIWKQSRTWDPEGPLSTIPAVATALLGVLAARLVRERKIKMLTIFGVAGIAAGWLWGLLFPLNKNLWTSSYVLYTAGWACVILALWMWKGPARPFVVFGVNPLVAFVGSGMMARLLGIIKIGEVSLQQTVYRALFKPYFMPQLASFLYALLFVAVWWGILALLYRRNIILKV